MATCLRHVPTNDSISQRQHRTLMRGIPIRPSAVNHWTLSVPTMACTIYHVVSRVPSDCDRYWSPSSGSATITAYYLAIPVSPDSLWVSGWAFYCPKRGLDPHTWGLVPVLLVDIEIMPMAIPILSRRELEASTLPRLCIADRAAALVLTSSLRCTECGRCGVEILYQRRRLHFVFAENRCSVLL